MTEWQPRSEFVDHQLQQYLARFDEVQNSTDCSTLKLESAQHFIEPGNDSWDLFVAGDWTGALNAVDEMAEDLSTAFAELQARGISTRRLRLVEQPVSPYLQWELHVLRARSVAGEQIRVLPKSSATLRLGYGPREFLFMGNAVLFDIIYSRSGRLDGAREFAWDSEAQMLYETTEDMFATGEDLLSYFDRVIAPMPAPNTE